MPSAPAPSHDRLTWLGRLTLKELREILRDRRTIITLVLMPLLLYPLLSVAFQQFFLSQLASTERPRHVIGFRTVQEAMLFKTVLSRGGLEFVNVEDESSPGPPDAEAKPLVVAGLVSDMEAALREFDINVGLQLQDDGNVNLDPEAEITVDAELLFRNDSQPSRSAAELVERHLAIANQRLLAGRLRSVGIRQRSSPVRAARRDMSEASAATGTISITAVIPFILILMTVTGAVYPAIDLTAGERERGTLEVLVAAPIPRISLLFAKYIAVLAVALLTAAANLLTMTLTIRFSGLSALLFGESGLSIGVITAVFALLLLFAAFFSAVLLMITSAARSFKEAQAYLIPLMLVSLSPGILSLMPDVKLSGLLLVTPLANIVLLGRDLLMLNAGGLAVTIVVLSTIAYAAAAIALAARIFGAESVLYNEQAGWSDLLRRPREQASAPTITAGLVCLALMVPVYYVLMASAGSFGDSLPAQLFAGLLTTAIVFGALPWYAAWHGRIRTAAAFSLRVPSIVAVVSAILLGLSLWTLDMQVVRLMQLARGATLDRALLERVIAFASKLRELPVPLVVLCIAVVPAVFEEAFFRGYLFAALRTRSKAWGAILTSALLFGLFHVIMPNPLASERLLSSTLLGVVLGWIRWRSGSLFPGIILHICHNGLMVLVAYYEPQISAAGWAMPSPLDLQTGWQALPTLWLAVGGATSLAGAALAAICCAPPEE